MSTYSSGPLVIAAVPTLMDLGGIVSKVLSSIRVSSPFLFALSALQVAMSHARHDFGGVATGLCLCVCAAGLTGEDLLQRDYRRDRVVLAYVARHPGVDVVQVARALGDPDRIVVRSLARLEEDGLLVCVVEHEPSGGRTYHIAG